jgi:hypothetical protein
MKLMSAFGPKRTLTGALCQLPRTHCDAVLPRRGALQLPTGCGKISKAYDENRANIFIALYSEDSS